jgi:glycosyltransferase involved in cell wall biosynthesis
MNSRAPGHLRIAQIAPVAAAVGPDSDDSVTGLVFLLTEELVRRGYRVTLFATADSQTSAELTALYEHGYEDDEEQWDWQFNESMNVANACARADQFDLIHCHTVPYGLPFAPFVDIPTIHTLHGDVGPSVVEAYHYFARVQVVAVSQFQRRRFEDRPNVELIHHGIDIEAFPFSPGAGDYLLFLGRMSANNGPGQAVEVARASGTRLVLAGPAEEGFEEEIAPLLDAGQVSYVGRPNPRQRNRLLAGAGALVYPVAYPEPFSLVLIEAMACGTPVLGVEIGPVPEIVDPGLTGYMAGSWEGLAEQVPDALRLDRAAIRARASERFAFERMVDSHEQLYQRLAHREPSFG